MILGGKTRRILAELRKAVAEWPPLPADAAAYHRRRSQLETLLDDLDGRIFLAADQVEEASALVGGLSSLGIELGRLFQERSAIEGWIEALDAPARELPDEVVATIRERQKGWRAALHRAGGEARDLRDVRIDQERLVATGDEVQAFAACVRAIAELLRLAQRPVRGGPAVDTARFVKGLLELPASATAESRALTSETRVELDRVRSLLNARSTVSPVSHELNGRIQILQGWIHVLPAFAAKLAALVAARDVAAEAAENGDGESPEGDLRSVAESLLAQCEEAAKEIRARQRQQLQARLAALSRIGAQKDIQEKLDGLADQPCAMPAEHQRWVEALRELETTSRNRLQNEQEHLAEAVGRLRGEVASRLERLRQQPLGSEEAAATFRIAEQEKRLGEGDGAEGRLAVLVDLGGLNEELTRLLVRSEQRTLDLRNKADELEERFRVLAAQARRVETILHWSPPAIALEPSRQLDLPTAQAAQQRLESEIAAAETSFVDLCADRRVLLEQAFRRFAELMLRAAFFAPMEPTPPDSAGKPEDDTSPVAVAASGLHLAAARYLRERRRLQPAFVALQARVAATELPASPMPGELDGGSRWSLRSLRDERSRLLGKDADPPFGDEADNGVWPPEDAEIERGAKVVEACLEFLEKVEDYQARRDQEIRKAEAAAVELAERLRNLERCRLAEFCPPRLLARVSVLVDGLEAAGAAGALAGQATAARHLVESLERHARGRLQLAMQGEKS